MEEVEVPSYFVCPITLDVMRDPVTLPTSITYDRHAIHRWLRLAASCPLTKLPVLPDCEPTPNHTLSRLIRSWCALHRPDDAVDRTMNSAPADRARLAALVSRLADAKNKGPAREALAALRELRDVAAEGERGRELIAAVPGSADALLEVFVASATCAPDYAAAALDVISSLRLPERCLAHAVDRDGAALVGALVSTLQGHSGSDAGMGASTAMATKAALRVLAGATAHGRNRVKAAEAGAVAALVDLLLLVNGERRRAWCELALCALNRLCGCAEGRAALVAHGAGVAAVGAWVAGASMAASAKAVRVLRSIARHAATVAVVQEMAATGAVGKLCLVAASAAEEGRQWCDERTRERARETLRLHARAWRSSPCLHPTLQALYPC
ncbi:unnamed protein product [Triticum turgidum subsp. durum]|uniref:U-box domain-containing protein n=1 Tax=Triticum turgidum subsp. durum TaxID=4567 RepID=A0A9R1Q3C8_TRITD|nr:unnamed protein product [Triticum turgidum subsp. durum]